MALNRAVPRRLLAVLGAAAALFYGVWGGEYSLWDLRNLEQNRQTELAATAELRGRTADLRRQADLLQSDPAALERVARERFGMIRPGEVLVRFVAPAPAKVRASEP